MTVKVIKKVGNSASLTLDKALLELLQIKIGDKVSLTVSNGNLIVSPTNRGIPREQLLKVADDVFKRYPKMMKELAK